MELQIPDILLEVNVVSTTVRLMLALLCGGVLGIERGRKKRPAGFRTYMLVCVGAALVMITNQYIYDMFPGTDPTRMGAQVVSGIGFLGAGTIIVTGRNRVRGLTTAAGLWAAACVGLSIGIGFYLGAIIGLVLTFVAMATLHNFDNRVTSSTRIINLYIEIMHMSDIGEFLKFAKEHEFKISDLEISKSKSITDSTISILLTLQSLKKTTHVEMIELLNTVKGVMYVEEI